VYDFLASNIIELNFRFWQYFYVSICHVTFSELCDFVIGIAPINHLYTLKNNYLLHEFNTWFDVQENQEEVIEEPEEQKDETDEPEDVVVFSNKSIT
jgi:hypothetical protein